MTPSDLIAEIKKLQFEEIRNNSTQLFEIVIRTDRAQTLYPILEGYFGPALKPAGAQPNRQVSEKVTAYGGIRKEQILYFIEQPTGSAYAMIWPWSNGILITLKIVHNPPKS